MSMPFTVEQFLQVFENYNRAVWPMPIVTYLLGIIAVGLVVFRVNHAGRLVVAILAFFWIWNGLVYHILFFSEINLPAYGFGALFIIQSILFLIYGTLFRKLNFKFELNTWGWIGIIFIVYAMLIYPFLGWLAGHGYPKSPVFGLAPCPTTIFTWGLLLWAAGKVHLFILIIPLLWSIIGFSAAVSLGVPEDFGLFVAGILGTILIIYRNRKINRLSASGEKSTQ